MRIYQPAWPRLVAHLDRGIPVGADGQPSKWDKRLFVLTVQLILLQAWFEVGVIKAYLVTRHIKAAGVRILVFCSEFFHWLTRMVFPR